MTAEEQFAGALTVAEFCARYRVGRTRTYEIIKSGQLSARKFGAKTLILKSEAERWAHALPLINVGFLPKEN